MVDRPESGFERLKLLITLSNANMPRKRKPDYSDIPLETQKRMGRYIPPEKSESKPKAPIPLRPFIWAERRLEAVLKMLQQLALLEILSIIGNVGLIVAIAVYVGSEKQRRDAEVLNAWQTLTSSRQWGSDTGAGVFERFTRGQLETSFSVGLYVSVLCVA
ncbi:MAG: hypothetical protein AAF215_11725 [Cyanobacteria bacterium P01_A01_bin.123]